MASQFQAKSPEDAEKGLIFMQEMVELSKTQNLVGAMTQLQVKIKNMPK